MAKKIFTKASTKQKYQQGLQNKSIDPSSVGFIQDTKEIYAQGDYYGTLPSNGKEGNILVFKDGKAQWDEKIMEQLFAYGIEYNISHKDPDVHPIGNLTLHTTLPIQNKFRGCVTKGNQLNYYLDSKDWRYKFGVYEEVNFYNIVNINSNKLVIKSTFNASINRGQFIKFKIAEHFGIVTNVVKESNSTLYIYTIEYPQFENLSSYEINELNREFVKPAIIGSNLSGYDGTVRVHTPRYYYKATTIGQINRLLVSEYKISGDWKEQKSLYIDAFKCAKLAFPSPNMGYVGNFQANALISVLNTTSNVHGGSETSSNKIGYPVTNMTLPDLERGASRAANARLLSYEEYKNIFYWLWVIESKTFNSQKSTSEGGMGKGTYPEGNIVYCGAGLSSGNSSSSLLIYSTPPYKFPIPSSLSSGLTSEHYKWRGFEGMIGDLPTYIDGISIMSFNQIRVYQTAYDTLSRIISYYPVRGYTSRITFGEFADITPVATGATPTTSFCDGVRIESNPRDRDMFFVGGYYNYGDEIGIGSFTKISYGTRLFATYRTVHDAPYE